MNGKDTIVMKSWGSLEIVDEGEGYAVLKAVLKPGARFRYHSHSRRNEVWTVLKGTGKTLVDGLEETVRPGDVASIQSGCRHTVTANEEMTLLEIQLGGEIEIHDKQTYEYPF